MTDRVATILQGRRERMARLLDRPLAQPTSDAAPLSDEQREHLLGDGRDLYWNELEWEHLTDEEAVEQGEPLTELMFPGLLAYVRGLLLTHVNPDALAPAAPRPEVVEELLHFLVGRVVELEEVLDETAGSAEGEQGRLRGELRATDRLVDLVLYHFHGLSREDIHLLETAGSG